MEESLRAHLDTHLRHLESLIRFGRQLRDALVADPASKPVLVRTRAWQQDCAAAVNELSGGSKAHWLARAYSEAFLVRSTGGRVIEEADVAGIVDRIVHVLEQAVRSLSRMGEGGRVSSGTAPPAHRFDFVHNAALRPILEQAYVDSRSAFERGEFGLALITACGVLEAVITDALEHLERQRSLGEQVARETPAGTIAEWSFETRIAVAEKAGLIRGGCARLPPVARTYRELSEGRTELQPDVTISEREARLAGQVLRVVMRDLDPGR